VTAGLVQKCREGEGDGGFRKGVSLLGAGLTLHQLQIVNQYSGPQHRYPD